MNKNNSQQLFFILIFIVFFIAIAFPLVSKDFEVKINGKTVNSFPLTIKNGDKLSLHTNRNHNTTSIIDIRSNSPINLSSRKPYQYSCINQKTYCSYKINNFRNTTDIAFSTTHKIDIEKVEIRHLRHNSSNFLNKLDGSLLGISLVLLILTTWLTHKSALISQWILISYSALLLFLLDIPFFVSISTFLLFIYHSKNWIKLTERKPVLYTLLLSSIFFLLLFKYYHEEIHSLFYNKGSLSIAAPLGLSYFIIRIIDTQLKWYRNEIPHINLRQFICYIVFPATLPAGPIDTINNFHNNRLSKIRYNDIAYGICRVIIGLAKKVIIADFLLFQFLFEPGGFYDRIAFFPEFIDSKDILIFLSIMLIFVYLDFSAYSDISIGLSRLLGYKMVENFNWPLLSINIRIFWSRWHMSLSNWCMRNIYMPAMILTRDFYKPTFIVMITIGLWHSLSLSWLFWSLHHASGLSLVRYLENIKSLKKLNNLPPLVKHIWGSFSIVLTFLFAASAHAFTQFNDIETAILVYFRFWHTLPSILF